MIFRNQIILLIISFLLFFSYIRGFMYGIKRYQLNKSAYKKRKKGETFLEWLTYSRYKEEIPRIFRILNYFVLIIHPVVMIPCIFIRGTELEFHLGYIIVVTLFIFNLIWALSITLLFWSPKGKKYERWITKRRGQK